MQSTTPTLVGQDEEDSQRRLSMKSLSGPPSPTNSTGKDVEKGESSQYYAGNVVKFDEGDPEDPLNFSAVRKWLIVANVGMTTFAIAFGSSIYTGGFAPMREYFQCSSLTLTLGLSLYVLGFAFGPMLWAPLSELYGRRYVFAVSFGPFFLFQLGAGAARNIETMLIVRFLAGLFGSAPLTNSGGTISDMFSGGERGLAISIFALAPFAAPALGPAVGGFLTESVDWRWIFWIMTIFSALMYVIGLMVPETYAPVLLRRRAAALSQSTGLHYVSEYDLHTPKDYTLFAKLKDNLTRPFVLLFKELIVFLLSLYAAIVYGTLYLMFGAYPIVFQVERGFSPGIGGLAFMGIFIGFIIGVALNVLENRRYCIKLEAAGGTLPPEDRLPLACWGGVLMPMGLFVFAWTAVPTSIHWSLPILATIPFGTGMLLVFLSTTNYLVDTYLMYAASVLAAAAVFRALLGAAFPMFTPQLFARLGINWALTLVAFLSLACAPIPFLFIKYGPAIRKRSTFAPSHHLREVENEMAEVSR